METWKQIIFSITVIVFGFIGVSQQAVAETQVSGEELKTLLSGNTVEGRYIKWETTHKMYFSENGKLSRIDSNNNKEKGEWEINKSGELCISVRKTRCNKVMKRDDGGYDVFRRGDLKFTFDKILTGNPHNL